MTKNVTEKELKPTHHEVIIDAFKRGGTAKVRRLADAMRATLDSAHETAALLDALHKLDARIGGKSRDLNPEYLKTLEILDAAEAAVYLRSSTSTLAKLRCYGSGPQFIRQSARKVLYRRPDLDAWLNERSRTSTCQGA